MLFSKRICADGAVLLSLNLALICSYLIAPEQARATSQTQPLPGFKGRALVVLSEGDQSATAYADGVLDRPEGVADSLTVIGCSPDGLSQTRTLAISNSVLGWPHALSIAPDGRHAYIVETRSAPTPGKVKDVLKNLPDGHLLTTVDLTDLEAPKIVDQRPIAINPWTVDVSPDGRTLAVDTRQGDANLLLIDLVDGIPGAVSKIEIKNHRGDKAPINSVRWSPVGNVLALNLDDKELAFLQVKRSADGLLHDTPVLAYISDVGKQITPGKFSPDGRFYMMTDLDCGKSPLAYLSNGKGRFVIVTTPLIADEKPHKILSTTTGITPEGFDLSADGTTLASVNMAHCFLPRSALFKLVPAQKSCSISVAKFDPANRKLSQSVEVAFDGLLPRDLTFDESGKYLVATVYQNTSEPANKGRLQFFRILENPALRVEAYPAQVTMPRGAHTIQVLKSNEPR